MKTISLFGLACLCLVVGMLPTPARAFLVSYQQVLTVKAVGPGSQMSSPQFSAGDHYLISFTIDTLATPYSQTTFAMFYRDAITRATIVRGSGQTGNWLAQGTVYELDVSNVECIVGNDSPDFVIKYLKGIGADPAINDATFSDAETGKTWDATWNMGELDFPVNGTVTLGAATLGEALNYPDWSTVFMGTDTADDYLYFDGDYVADVSFTAPAPVLTSLTPEPSAAALLLGGLALACGVRRRRLGSMT